MRATADRILTPARRIPDDVRTVAPRVGPPTLDPILREKIETFSIRPSGCARAKDSEIIILAQYGDSLDAAFETARARLRAGHAVRVVGPGITLRRAWPAWVSEENDLTLTEWGAFRTTSEREATETLEDEFRVWIREIIGDFGGQAADRVFCAAASQRLLLEVLTVYPVARSLADAFPRALVHCERPRSLMGSVLQDLLERTGGRVTTSLSPPSSVPWRARIASLGAAGMVAATARVVRAYLDAAPSRRAIRELRRKRPPVLPDTWVGVTPDWYRINHHLLDAFAVPETADGTALGVLFVGTLAPYARDEHTQRQSREGGLWPGLGALRDRLDRCPVDQAVMPEALSDFARSIAIGLARSVRALAALSSSPSIRLPSVRFSPSAQDLVRWATIDVLRATLGQAAARSLLMGVPMHGRTVIFAASNNAATAPVNLALRDAGAITVEHPHGSCADGWSAGSDNASSIRLVWAQPDATSAGPRVRTLLTGMPVRFELPPRERRATRILLMTSYVHRDSESSLGSAGGASRFPLLVFQAEMLDLIPRLRDGQPAKLVFRWRPHPADNQAEVARAVELLDDVELSRGRPLQEDAAWADIIVSSNSTAVVEALFAGVPVFAHLLAEQSGIPATSYLAAERIFYHAEDGARRIREWLDAYGDRPADGLNAERQARAALFGDTLAPVAMTTYFGNHHTHVP